MQKCCALRSLLRSNAWECPWVKDSLELQIQISSIHERIILEDEIYASAIHKAPGLVGLKVVGSNPNKDWFVNYNHCSSE